MIATEAIKVELTSGSFGVGVPTGLGMATPRWTRLSRLGGVNALNESLRRVCHGPMHADLREFNR